MAETKNPSIVALAGEKCEAVFAIFARYFEARLVGMHLGIVLIHCTSLVPVRHSLAAFLKYRTMEVTPRFELSLWGQ